MSVSAATKAAILAHQKARWAKWCQASAAGATDKTTRVGVWRSVAEGVPDSHQTVLYYTPHLLRSTRVWLGFHDGGSWCEVSGEMVEGVTHWMQLPEPPAL